MKGFFELTGENRKILRMLNPNNSSSTSQVRSRHHILICPHLSSSLWLTKRVPIKKGAKKASSKIGLLADTCTTTRLICMRFSSMDKMCLKCKAAN